VLGLNIMAAEAYVEGGCSPRASQEAEMERQEEVKDKISN
jgi:hypothetical protein